MSVGRAGQSRARLKASPAETSSARWAQIWASRALLLRVARRSGANAEEAEDVAQEAMLRAAEHPEITAERLQAWLVTVTRRLCMDGHRQRTKEVSRWKQALAQAAVQQPGQHIEEDACARSEAAWVAALATELLPPRQVKALRLAASGCDVSEVATQLGVHYRAAESLLARARRTLRTAVSVSLGLVAWTWRANVPSAGNPVPMALASAATATMMVALPPVLDPPDRPTNFSSPPPSGSLGTPAPPPISAVTPSTRVRTSSVGGARSQPRLEPNGPLLPAASLDRTGSFAPPVLPELPGIPPLLPTAVLNETGLPLTSSPPELPGTPPLLPPAPLDRTGSLTPSALPELPGTPSLQSAVPLLGTLPLR